jgi:hypothetical protein
MGNRGADIEDSTLKAAVQNASGKGAITSQFVYRQTRVKREMTTIWIS